MAKTVYLAHPYSKKNQIQQEFQPKLEALGLTVINPFIRPQQAKYASKMADGRGSGGLDVDDCREIVEMDLAKIDAVDAVVAALIDDNMIGTLMEIFYTSFCAHKPVFAWASRPREQESPWTRVHARIYPTQEACVAAVEEWMNG